MSVGNRGGGTIVVGYRARKHEHTLGDATCNRWSVHVSCVISARMADLGRDQSRDSAAENAAHLGSLGHVASQL